MTRSTISVRPCDLPKTALLRRYQDGGGFADCYVTEVAGTVSQQALVEAFYTSSLFKVERAILRWFAGRPSSDQGARALADGSEAAFAAWQVEARSDDQLLLADFTGRTRSWLMTSPSADTAESRTLLYFGSAVVPRRRSKSDKPEMGFAFNALYGFHQLYSRLLLRSARSRLVSGRRGTTR